MDSGRYVTPLSPLRATVSDEGRRLTIVFPPPRRWPARLALPLLLGMLGFCFVSAVRDLPAGLANTRTADAGGFAFLLLFLLLALGAGVSVAGLMLYRCLFDAAGRELIVVDAAQLTLRREFPFLTRNWAYPLADIRSLRAIPNLGPLWIDRWLGNSRYAYDFFGLTGGVIAFECRGKTVRVGGGVEVAEAEYLVDRLRQRTPSTAAIDR